MRARNIKPGLYKNEELAELGPHAMILFTGLWCMADREGRLEDRPKRIAAEIFPYWRDVDVESLLAGLASKRFIIRYELDGRSFVAIPRTEWKRHQRPHANEASSILPDYQDETSTIGRSASTIGASPCYQGEKDLLPNTQALRSDSGLSDSGLSDSLIPETNTQRARENHHHGTGPNAPAPQRIPREEIPAGEIETVIDGMRERHAKKNRLGGVLLAQAICGKVASSANPRATLSRIGERHRIACESEWRGQESRFWPDLVRWVEDDRWLDPEPAEAARGQPVKPNCERCGDAGRVLRPGAPADPSEWAESDWVTCECGG